MCRIGGRPRNWRASFSRVTLEIPLLLHWKKAGTTPAFFSIREHEVTPISVMISSLILEHIFSPILEHIFFKTGAGNEPVKKWLDELGEGDKNDEKAIYADITVVAERWPQVLHTRLVKKVQGEKNLWEIRSHLSRKRIARVLFTLEASENPEVNVRKRYDPPARFYQEGSKNTTEGSAAGPTTKKYVA